MALFSPEKLHYGWIKFSNSTFANPLEWLFLPTRSLNFLAVFFLISGPGRFEWVCSAVHENGTSANEKGSCGTRKGTHGDGKGHVGTKKTKVEAKRERVGAK